MAIELFSVPLFFIVLREALEAAVIVSVLLTFIDRIPLPSLDGEFLRVKLKKLVWLGMGIGFLVVILGGSAIIVVWYTLGKNIWEGVELLWEGVFGMIASILITLTAFSVLNSQHLMDNLRKKITERLRPSRVTDDETALAFTDSDLIESEAEPEEQPTRQSQIESKGNLLFFWVPCLTILREGLEAVVFIGGVATTEPASSIPLAATAGLAVGFLIGVFIHSGGSKIQLQRFFIISSYVLLLIAAGLASKSVGFFEDYFWSLKVQVDPDAVDAVFFDPTKNIWMLPCCKKNTGIWAVLSALLGWRDVATIGTVVTYCAYWICVSIYLVITRQVASQ
jgi:high-affinity iron transporter